MRKIKKYETIIYKDCSYGSKVSIKNCGVYKRKLNRITKVSNYGRLEQLCLHFDNGATLQIVGETKAGCELHDPGESHLRLIFRRDWKQARKI